MTHVNIGKQHPDAYQAYFAFNDQVIAHSAAAGIDKRLVELIKVRVSQLNGCAFCLRAHNADALNVGESPDRLAVVAAWWETQYFTDTERAALQLAEQITFQGDPASVPDRGIQPSLVLTDEQYSAVAWLSILMNGWNRVAVTSHYPVAP